MISMPRLALEIAISPSCIEELDVPVEDELGILFFPCPSDRPYCVRPPMYGTGLPRQAKYQP